MPRNFHTAGWAGWGGGLAAGSASARSREGRRPCPQAPRASEAQASIMGTNVIPEGALGRRECQAGLLPTLPKKGRWAWGVGDICVDPPVMTLRTRVNICRELRAALAHSKPCVKQINANREICGALRAGRG